MLFIFLNLQFHFSISPPSALSRQELEIHMSQYDLKRLECYSRNMADYHLIMDLLPTISKIYCLGMMGDTHFSAVQLVNANSSVHISILTSQDVTTLFRPS